MLVMSVGTQIDFEFLISQELCQTILKYILVDTAETKMLGRLYSTLQQWYLLKKCLRICLGSIL